VVTEVFDASTLDTYNRPIATGNITDYTLPAQTIMPISFPLSVDYIGKDSTDPTLLDFVAACTSVGAGVQQATLNLRVDVTMFVWGIDWIYKPKVSVPVPDFKCPYP